MSKEPGPATGSERQTGSCRVKARCVHHHATRQWETISYMRRSEHFPRTAYPGLPIIWALLAAGVGALIVHPPTLVGKAAVLAGILLLAAACFLPLLLWRSAGVSPGFVYALATFATFGLGSFAWFGEPLGAAPGLDQQLVARALLTASAGMTAFWIGYRLARPPRDVRSGSPRVIVPVWLLFALFTLGLAANLILFLTGRFAYLAYVGAPAQISWWQQWLITGAGLTGISTNLASLHAFGNDSKSHQRAMVAMLAISTALGVVSGFKGFVILPFVWTLFVYYYYRRRLPLKLLALALLATLVLVPPNLSYRYSLQTGSSVQTGSIASVLSTVNRTFSDSLRTPIGDRISVVTQWSSVRFRNIDSLAQIERLTPSQFPYLGAGLYAQIPAIALVPRLLWPGKPTMDLGVQFGVRYFGALPGYKTSTPITNMGDLYMHAGPWGVGGGMAIWGALAGLLFRWLRRRESPQALVVYLTAIGVYTQTELDFTNLLAGAFRALLLAWLVGRLLYGPMPVHPHRALDSSDRVANHQTYEQPRSRRG